jgi:hypothetical protein
MFIVSNADCGLRIAECGAIDTSFLVISQFLRIGLVDSFLAADLHAETAVHTGESVDLHSAILSFYQRGALESFETVSTPDTGPYGWHIDG